jgi:5-keto 4-deoxyuronate isomerase
MTGEILVRLEMKWWFRPASAVICYAFNWCMIGENRFFALSDFIVRHGIREVIS